MAVRYHSAEKLTEDDFGVQFTMQPGEVVYDARTRIGPWACMTEKSFRTHGCGMIGTGSGQKYVRNAEGHLVKVEG